MTRGTYKTKPIPGSFADPIGIFRTQSPRYRGWARATRKHADKVLDDFPVDAKLLRPFRQGLGGRRDDIIRQICA